MPLSRNALLRFARKGLIQQLAEIDAELASASKTEENGETVAVGGKRKRKGWSRARRAAFRRKSRPEKQETGTGKRPR
jgi:hypothetical protein